MLLFVLVFRHSRLYTQYHQVYTLLVKGWICICLFFLADVLAALVSTIQPSIVLGVSGDASYDVMSCCWLQVAKAMSRHFHSISTFLRMQVRCSRIARGVTQVRCRIEALLMDCGWHGGQATRWRGASQSAMWATDTSLSVVRLFS
jgi:hypothetical protein